jgi:hypothetical protein
VGIGRKISIDFYPSFRLSYAKIHVVKQQRMTESGVGGGTLKGLQPLRGLLAPGHRFLVRNPAKG